MTQPTPYERLYNFTDWQTVNPTKPLPATQMDAELNAVKLTSDQTRLNLALIQRDDGKLTNQSVTPESLSAGTLAMISQGEYVPRGDWITARAYIRGDVVNYNAATYLCTISHISTLFANDLNATNWLLIANGALSGGNSAVDLFVGTGAQTAFTLSYFYASANGATVFVSGVAQIPTLDFTIVGTALTFVVAPAAPSVSGRTNVMVRGTGVEAQLSASNASTQAENARAYSVAAASSATSAANSAASISDGAAASLASAAQSATSASAAASSATTAANAVLAVNLPASLTGKTKNVLRVNAAESGYELVASAALPTFFGFSLSADGTEILLTTDRTGLFNTSDFISWSISENVAFTIESNQLALTI